LERSCRDIDSDPLREIGSEVREAAVLSLIACVHVRRAIQENGDPPVDSVGFVVQTVAGDAWLPDIGPANPKQC
jgi:hypothetical protein